MSISTHFLLLGSHNIAKNFHPCFSQVKKDIAHRMVAINHIFELARLHRGIQKSCSQGAQWAIDARYKIYNPLLREEDDEAEAQASYDMAALFRKASEENFSLSAVEASVIELSGPITTMALYGLGSTVLGIYASQLPLESLMALTWGSFRWNEAEILNRLWEQMEGQHQSRCHFWGNIFVLMTFYLFSCLYWRDRVTFEMKSKAKEFLAPCQPVITFAFLCQADLFFQRNKEEILNGMPEELRPLLSRSLSLLNRAIEKQDLEEMMAQYKEIKALVKESELRGILGVDPVD